MSNNVKSNLSPTLFLFAGSLVCVLLNALGASSQDSEADRPHVVFLIHEDEYEAARTLPQFGRTELEEGLNWNCTYLLGERLHHIEGLEALEDADLLVVYARRQVYPAEQLNRIKAYCEAGKPVVGIRTASHAFAGRRGRTNPDGVEWAEFDRDVLGGNYTGHFDNKDESDPPSVVWAAEEMKDHPVLQGVELQRHETPSWLYKTKPLAESARVLMYGAVQGTDDVQPVTWTNRGKYGNRVFYTSMGHLKDFERESFRQLLRNGMEWALRGEVTEE